MDSGDVAILVGCTLTGIVGGSRLGRDAGCLDDLEEPTVWNDGETIRLQNGEKRLVCLSDRDLLRRIHCRLDVADLATEDEALAGQLTDDANDLGKVGVLERERYFVVRVLRLEVESLLELRERPRISLSSLDGPGACRWSGARRAGGCRRRRSGRRWRRPPAPGYLGDRLGSHEGYREARQQRTTQNPSHGLRFSESIGVRVPLDGLA